MKLTHAGYFEGIGGFSLGAERAGLETIYTCEIDEYRHDFLKYYLPNATHERDIKTAKGCYADIFTAGFPCQDISIANSNGKGLSGERSGLFFDFIKIVCRIRPKYVILENSPMLVYRKDLLRICREFAQCGYNAEWQIISKRAFGYPDERKRLIFIAYRSEIGCQTSNRIFEKKSFEKCIKAQKQNEFIQHQLSRGNSILDWKRFITKSLSNNTGLSKKLVKNEIAAYGDAICPDIAQLAFEMIKKHYTKTE